MTAREHAEAFAKSMRCNCETEPTPIEESTGHTAGCRIHTTAMAAMNAGRMDRGGKPSGEA